MKKEVNIVQDPRTFQTVHKNGEEHYDHSNLANDFFGKYSYGLNKEIVERTGNLVGVPGCWEQQKDRLIYWVWNNEKTSRLLSFETSKGSISLYIYPIKETPETRLTPKNDMQLRSYILKAYSQYLATIGK